MAKYALNNSYFKNRGTNDPETILGIVTFFKQTGELPFRYQGDSWLYDTVCERQKRRGVQLDQYLTPTATAQRMAELAANHRPQSGIVLDACCGTGQLTAPLLNNGLTVEAFDIDPEMIDVCSILYPQATFLQMDYEQAEAGKRYDLIVANPPYDTRKLQVFMRWLHLSLNAGGKAVLLLPSGFIDKQRPKVLTETLSKFLCIHREAMSEQFAHTNVQAEIVLLEQGEEAGEDAATLSQAMDEAVEQESVNPVPAAEEPALPEKPLRVTASNHPDPLPNYPTSIQHVELAKIVCNPYNPRKYHSEEDLLELASSITVHGVIQPVTLRPKGELFEIVCGERRYRSSLMVGLNTIPAIVKPYTDDQAMEITILENLQRKDVSPVEEAACFGQLVELRGYTIEVLVKRFGKSDKYVRSRLQLRNLIEQVAMMLVKDELSLGNALELSRYCHDIQQAVYTEHLDQDGYQCWRELGTVEFRNRMDRAYSTDLSKFKFDQSACRNCRFNSAVYDLFSQDRCGNCQQAACLKEKQSDYMVNTTVEMLTTDPGSAVCVTPYSNAATSVVERLKEMGYEVVELYPTNYPCALPLPTPEDYPSEKAYKEALAIYETENSNYAESMEEIDQMAAQGSIRKLVDVSDLTPRPCYTRIKEETVQQEENPIDRLRKQDERNREIAVEKTVEDVKRFLKEEDLPASEFHELEQELLYYLMMGNLRLDHFGKLGFEESWSLSDEQKADLLPALTEEQKTIVRRDFIVRHLSETFGVRRQSELLLAFSALHFPEKTAEIKEQYNEIYRKRHDRIQERILLLEGAAEQAGKSDAGKESTAEDTEQDTAIIVASEDTDTEPSCNEQATDRPDVPSYGDDTDGILRYEGIPLAAGFEEELADVA